MIPDFAKVLSDYIHEKNVNVYSMAQFCDLDRSTMYKFINGKRRPSSISLVRKMADFMLLTPAEYQLLSEAYRISLVGPEIYFRRKYIWKFLQNPGKYISALPVNFTKTGAHSGGAADNLKLQTVCLKFSLKRHRRNRERSRFSWIPIFRPLSIIWRPLAVGTTACRLSIFSAWITPNS